MEPRDETSVVVMQRAINERHNFLFGDLFPVSEQHALTTRFFLLSRG